MIFKNPLLLAFAINLPFLLLYFAFGQVRQGSLDDYFMSGVLTGAYGSDYDVHMFFVNAAYGYFLKPFYWLFPKAGWYYIFELLGTFSAFTAITYVVIRKIGTQWGILVAALILASLTPDFYFQLSFTQCATLYTAAGILLIAFGSLENARRLLVVGGFFVVAGSIMRWEGFLLGLPYLVVLLAAQWFDCGKLRRLVIIALASTFVVAFGLREYDKTLYAEGDYKYYADYQPVRAYFGDGAFYDQESTYDELEERGMSGLDYNLLKSWVYYDTEVFCIDSLLPIKEVAQNNRYSLNWKRLPAAFFLAVSNAFMRCSGWCWVLLCTLLILTGTKKSGLYPWVSLGIVALSIGYLLWVNRLVYHVESGVWLYAIVFVVPCLEDSFFKKNVFLLKRNNILKTGLLLVSIIFVTVEIMGQSSLKRTASLIETPTLTDDWKSFLEYTQKHQDDVFLLSFEQYKVLGSLKNPAYLAIEPGSWNNIYSWGYWNIHLPAMKNELSARGVENPLRDIVRNNVYVLQDGFRQPLEKFYEKHYHKRIVSDTAVVFGSLVLQKYRLVD